MARIEVDIYGQEVNALVLRAPGRKYPGILIQGDSLHILCSRMHQVLEGCWKTGNEDLVAEAEEVLELLKTYMHAYVSTLRANGFEVPADFTGTE